MPRSRSRAWVRGIGSCRTARRAAASGSRTRRRSIRRTAGRTTACVSDARSRPRSHMMASIAKMRLGVVVSPAAGFSYDEIKEIGLGAERAGFDSFWVSDHFYGGRIATPDRDCLEAWTLLAALARDTTRIRLGTLVTAVQYRNPALLAKIAAGVDQLSGGRIEFGIGAG